MQACGCLPSCCLTQGRELALFLLPCCVFLGEGPDQGLSEAGRSSRWAALVPPGISFISCGWLLCIKGPAFSAQGRSTGGGASRPISALCFSPATRLVSVTGGHFGHLRLGELLPHLQESSGTVVSASGQAGIAPSVPAGKALSNQVGCWRCSCLGPTFPLGL